jgi:adenylate kinase
MILGKSNPLTIIFVGPSGSGKGTQASILVDKFDLAYVEMGRIIRAEAKKDTELGKKINQIVMMKGKLLPDEISYQLLENKILSVPSNKDLILDGYPRTLKQVKDLDKLLTRTSRERILVFHMHIPDGVAIERLSKRLVCASCKSNFIENNLKVGSSCPKCSGKLIKRPDDTPEKIKERLTWSHKEVEPVVEEYRKRGVLVDIDGNQEFEKVTEQIVSHLKKYLE